MTYCEMGWQPRKQGNRPKKKTPTAFGRRGRKYFERKKD
jgi:hypothetical protein